MITKRIEYLKNKYCLQYFVETGCADGVSLAAAKSLGFNSLYSCDVSIGSVEQSKNKVPEANIYHLDSLEFLKTITTIINIHLCPTFCKWFHIIPYQP